MEYTLKIILAFNFCLQKCRYKPPDILLGMTDYDADVDIWSAGCIVYEMMNGRAPFKGSDYKTQAYKIFEILGNVHCLLCP